MSMNLFNSLASQIGREKTLVMAKEWIQDEEMKMSEAKSKTYYSLVDINKEYAIIAKIDANVLKSKTSSVNWGKGLKHHPANIYVRDVIDAMRARDYSTNATISYDTCFNDKKVANIIRELKKQGIVAVM